MVFYFSTTLWLHHSFLSTLTATTTTRSQWSARTASLLPLIGGSVSRDKPSGSTSKRSSRWRTSSTLVSLALPRTCRRCKLCRAHVPLSNLHACCTAHSSSSTRRPCTSSRRSVRSARLPLQTLSHRCSMRSGMLLFFFFPSSGK